MKFLHIGDLHLGRSIGEFDLIEDQKYILDQILDIARQRAVDAVLIAGDVYDKSIPSEAAVRLLDYFIRRLVGERLPAFLISGNHDSDERMNFGSSLFRANGIYIAAKYEGELLHLRAKKGETGLEVSCVEDDSPEMSGSEKIEGEVEKNRDAEHETAENEMDENRAAESETTENEMDENRVAESKTAENEGIETDTFETKNEEKGTSGNRANRATADADEDGEEVNIYLMPFIKASQVRHFLPEEGIENYEDAVRAVLKHAGVDPARKNVLVAHQFVAGSACAQKDDGDRIREISVDGEQIILKEKGAGSDNSKKAEREKKGEKSYTDPILSGSEGIATQNVGLVEKIGADCFDAFDYVALGHIHSPQAVGREEVRYSGSPLKYSLSEANHVKSVPIVTLGKKGEVQVELVPLRPLRDLRHIRGRMEQLLAKENITAPDDFMYVTLTDEDVIDEAMGIFQQYYPNTIRIEYDNSHTKELQETEAAYVTPDVSFDDLIAGFYRQIYGCDISAEERKLMRETAREAGLEIGEDEILPTDNEIRMENEEKGIPIKNETDEASTGKETGDGGDAK
ncbi:MAG: exonuclease SbcCD subunit D [Lachnospiraceae bacterium]|nr:exonuclease SbcCD subunit D [Lachnospiraceae bacterium]